jgi:acyl-CoA thioester hydrolase
MTVMANERDSTDAPAAASQVQLRVRYAECDAMGVLHHARYWEYFELARTELLRAKGHRYRDLEAGGICFVVYKCSCTYKAPVRYDDLVTVRAWVTRQSRTRIDHAYQIIRDGQVCCQASTTLACVDRDARPILMPPDLWPESE